MFVVSFEAHIERSELIIVFAYALCILVLFLNAVDVVLKYVENRAPARAHIGICVVSVLSRALCTIFTPLTSNQSAECEKQNV